MKTYIYRIIKKKLSFGDDYNLNHISVYRVKNNKPIFLGNQQLNYMSGFQVACDLIAEAENWGKKVIHSPNGFSCNGVRQAWRDGKINLIQI